jgi:hypothetical protein
MIKGKKGKIFILKKKTKTMEFRINKYITLKLEKKEDNSKRRQTVIYVNGGRFDQCKFLFMEISPDKINSGEVGKLKSVDKAADKLGRDLEPRVTEYSEEWEEYIDMLNRILPDQTEFWGHCSNLQAWAEHDYNTNLLHSNLAFPLLRELSEAGDPKARKVYHEEVVKRYLAGNESVRSFLTIEGYLADLSIEERDIIFSSGRDLYAIKELEEILEQRLDLIPYKKIRGSVLRGGTFALKDGKVAWISLSSKTLTYLPEALRELKDLERLRIWLPKLIELPDWIGEFPKLRQLDISETPITTLPESIGNLKNLVRLDVSICQLNSIPKSIGNLTNLKILRLNSLDFQ